MCVHTCICMHRSYGGGKWEATVADTDCLTSLESVKKTAYSIDADDTAQDNYKHTYIHTYLRTTKQIERGTLSLNAIYERVRVAQQRHCCLLCL